MGGAAYALVPHGRGRSFIQPLLPLFSDRASCCCCCCSCCCFWCSPGAAEMLSVSSPPLRERELLVRVIAAAADGLSRAEVGTVVLFRRSCWRPPIKTAAPLSFADGLLSVLGGLMLPFVFLSSSSITWLCSCQLRSHFHTAIMLSQQYSHPRRLTYHEGAYMLGPRDRIAQPVLPQILVVAMDNRNHGHGHSLSTGHFHSWLKKIQWPTPYS